jgi:hypothetical protein
MSEPLSFTSGPPRGAFTGVRTSIFRGSSRLGRESLASDVASFVSSSRATTFSTQDDGIFSPPASNSRSFSSVSGRSQPGSVSGGGGLYRAIDRTQEKSTFLENLRQDLNSLLLSDLACPVWTCGSESDSWMDTVCQSPNIIKRLHYRSELARLLPPRDSTPAAGPSPATTKRNKQRSRSVAPAQEVPAKQPLRTQLDAVKYALSNGSGSSEDEFPYFNAFNDILCRIRDHTSPMMKLQAIRDFELLARDFQSSYQSQRPDTDQLGSKTADTGGGLRRRSLDPSTLSTNVRRHHRQKALPPATPDPNEEEEVLVQSLKYLLLELRPKTMFRDLQYIAAFVSSDNLADRELEQAFLHMGLAALAWKDEVCRAMVDVADRIVARDTIKRNVQHSQAREPSVLKAMEYWIIGAREGNSIAQRELASLYLTHPDVPPIVSLPLAPSSEIFKNDMMWEGPGESRRNHQALCLALHWMQAAADNGDQIAKTKLRERKAGRSVQ